MMLFLLIVSIARIIRQRRRIRQIMTGSIAASNRRRSIISRRCCTNTSYKTTVISLWLLLLLRQLIVLVLFVSVIIISRWGWRSGWVGADRNSGRRRRAGRVEMSRAWGNRSSVVRSTSAPRGLRLALSGRWLSALEAAVDLRREVSQADQLCARLRSLLMTWLMLQHCVYHWRVAVVDFVVYVRFVIRWRCF